MGIIRCVNTIYIKIKKEVLKIGIIKCTKCKRPIVNKMKAISFGTNWFCSRHCYEKYKPYRKVKGYKYLGR